MITVKISSNLAKTYHEILGIENICHPNTCCNTVIFEGDRHSKPQKNITNTDKYLFRLEVIWLVLGAQ